MDSVRRDTTVPFAEIRPNRAGLLARSAAPPPSAEANARGATAGAIVYQEPGAALFIQDEQEGLYCQTRQRVPVQVGDQVIHASVRDALAQMAAALTR